MHTRKIMLFKNLFIICCVSATLSLAKSSEPTTKNRNSQSAYTTSTIAIQTGSKALKKQQKIRRPNTTWSKIKDLFM